MYLLERRRAQIRQALEAAWQAAKQAGDLPEHVLAHYTLEAPRAGEHGDFACNLAMVLAGPCRRPPRVVAEALVRHFTTSAVADLLRLEIAGPGFLNFHLVPGWLAPAVDEVRQAGSTYGAWTVGADRRVLLEFVSANPTGPLNVVNCRAAAYGDALARLLRAVGYSVDTEYYVNDAGGQFRKLGLSLEARLRQLRGEVAEIPEGGYPGEYLLEVARAYLADRGAAILDQPEAERIETLGRYAVAVLLAQQEAVLARFGVHYTAFAHESAVRAAGGPEAVVAALEATGRTRRSEGALWLLTQADGDNDDRVLQKRDGEFTYRVPDIAYHVDKFRRGYDLLVDVFGQDHHGDILAVRLALQWLGHPVERLEVLITQLIRLVRDGQTGRVSKRAGNFVTMDDFLDEVGTDAARFFFLMRTIDTHMDFDVDLARSQSQENPVYYVQYAHARICSILRRAAEAPQAAAPDLTTLIHPAEAALCRSLAAFPDEVLAAAAGRAPHRLTAYCREAAEAFHAFYVQCPVLSGPAGLHPGRLALCQATATVLARALDLLGVSAPERM